MKSIIFSVFLLTLINVEPVFAIRQGAVTATFFIKMYEQRGEWEKVALWHEAAIECLLRISVPMNRLALKYHTTHNHPTWVKRCEQEKKEILAQRQSHLEKSKAAWKKSKTLSVAQNRPSSVAQNRPSSVAQNRPSSVAQNRPSSVAQNRPYSVAQNRPSTPALEAEREQIAKFISQWVTYYPERFYELGIYPTFFRQQRERAAEQGDAVQMLLIEADASEMCAALYDKIPIAYGLKRYEPIRDAYAHRARWLRTLASHNPTISPQGVVRQISRTTVREYINQVSTGELANVEQNRFSNVEQNRFSNVEQNRFSNVEQNRFSNVEQNRYAAAIIQIAKSDARVKSALAHHQSIREYAQFQGNAWTVSFSNQGWGNVVVAIVEHGTLNVLHVICQ